MPGSGMPVCRLVADLIGPGTDICKGRIPDQIVHGGFRLRGQVIGGNLADSAMTGNAPGKEGDAKAGSKEGWEDFTHKSIWFRKIAFSRRPPYYFSHIAFSLFNPLPKSRFIAFSITPNTFIIFIG